MHSPTPYLPRASNLSYQDSFSPPTPPRSVSPPSSSRHDRRRSSGDNSSSDSSAFSTDSWGHLRRDARTPGTSEDGGERRQGGGGSSSGSEEESRGKRPSFPSPGSTSLAVQAGSSSSSSRSSSGTRSGGRTFGKMSSLSLLTPPRSSGSHPEDLAQRQPSSCLASSSNSSLLDSKHDRDGKGCLHEREEDEEELFREVDELIYGEGGDASSESDWSVLGGGDVRDDEDDGDGEETDDSPSSSAAQQHLLHQPNSIDDRPAPLLRPSSSSLRSKLSMLVEFLPLPRFFTRHISSKNNQPSYLPLNSHAPSSSISLSQLPSSSTLPSHSPRLPSFLPHSASHPRISTHSSTRRPPSSYHNRQPSLSSPPLSIKLLQTLAVLLLPPLFLAIPIAISLYLLGDFYYLLGLYFFDWYSTAYTALFWVMVGGAMLAYGWGGFWMVVRMGKGLEEVWWSSSGSSGVGKRGVVSAAAAGERRRRKRRREREVASRGREGDGGQMV